MPFSDTGTWRDSSSFYFPGVLVGPSTRFGDYNRWAKGELYLPSKTPPPGRLWYSLKDVAFGMLCLGLQVLTMDRLSYTRLANASDAIQKTSLLNRIWFVQLCGLGARFRYYGIWSLSNAACVLSGLGYNGMSPETNTALWTRCKNVFVINIEFANNWKELMDSWNANTNVWLRNNVYKRLVPHGKRPGVMSMMATFMVSAFWHGISPGYYLTFLLGGLYSYVARLLRHSVRPVFFANTRTPNPTLFTLDKYTVSQVLYSLASVLVVQMTVNFAALSFLVLSAKASLRAWANVGYYGIVLLVVPILAFQLGLGKALKPFHQAPEAIPKKKN